LNEQSQFGMARARYDPPNRMIWQGQEGFGGHLGQVIGMAGEIIYFIELCQWLAQETGKRVWWRPAAGVDACPTLEKETRPRAPNPAGPGFLERLEGKLENELT
jgi:hypothetical protein